MIFFSFLSLISKTKDKPVIWKKQHRIGNWFDFVGDEENFDASQSFILSGLCPAWTAKGFRKLFFLVVFPSSVYLYVARIKFEILIKSPLGNVYW